MDKLNKEQLETIKLLIPYFSGFNKITIEDIIYYFTDYLEAKIQMQITDEAYIVVVYDGKPDSNGNLYGKYGKSQINFITAAYNLLYCNLIDDEQLVN